MAEYPLPSWLQVRGDPGAEYTSAFHAGAQIQLEKQRLQQEAAQNAETSAIRQQQLQQDAIYDRQKAATEDAYKTASLGLRKAELDATQQKINMTAADAARRFSAQQKAKQLIQSGVDPVQAWLQAGPAALGGGATERLAVEASRRVQPSFTPTVQDVEGHKVIMLGPERGQLLKEGNKPIKVGKKLVQVNEDGTVKELYSGETSGDSILGAAGETDTQPQPPGLLNRIKNVFSPSEPQPSKKYTAKDKAVRAHALAIAHPDWTKEQVIDAVNKEMP